MNLSPSQFAMLRGGESLYPWQYQALESLGKGWPTSLVTCNGAGKTAEIAARAAEWFFHKHPQGKLVATSGSFNQLQNQLWPALKDKLPNDYIVNNGSSPCIIRTPQGGVGVGFSTNDPRRAEGWHPTISPDVDPVMILIDEGKAVPNEIFVAFDRCTVKYILYISSPGPPYGRFYDTHTKLGKYFYTMQVSSYECPHISDFKRERDKEVLGESSPEFRSMHLAEFTDLDNHNIISATNLREALNVQPKINDKGERCAFFDFAAGGDENVFALRTGNKVRIIESWRDSNTVQAVRRFIETAQRFQLSGHQCWGDADGLGLPMVNQFADEGFRINAFRGGMPAEDKDVYSNLISETWINSLRLIGQGRYNLGELDVETFNQLTNRFLEWDHRGKLRVERKADMSARGIHSPDRADALLGCIACGSHMSGTISGETVDNTRLSSNDFASKTVRF